MDQRSQRSISNRSSAKMAAQRRSQMGPPGSMSHASVVSSIVDKWRRATKTRGSLPRTDAEVRDALVNASKRGQVDVMKDLVHTRDADVNAANTLGARPLTSAVRYGRKNAAQMLLESGADVNARDERSGTSALHWAAFKGNVSCVQVLLDAGADVNPADIDGSTPLHDAALRNHAKVVAMLLAAGAKRRPKKTTGEIPADLTKSNKIRDMLEDGVRRSQLESYLDDDAALTDIVDRLSRSSRPTNASISSEARGTWYSREGTPEERSPDNFDMSTYSLPSQPTEYTPRSGLSPKKTVSSSDADQYFPPRSRPTPPPYPSVNIDPYYIPPSKACRAPTMPPTPPSCYQPQFPSSREQYGNRPSDGFMPSKATVDFPRPQSPTASLLSTNQKPKKTFSTRCPGGLDPSPKSDIVSSCFESRVPVRVESCQSQSLALGEIVKAANSGRQDLVREIIRKRGIADEEETKNELHFALHRAARQGLPVAVKTLIRCGAMVNARDKGRLTPLHWAGANDNSQITFELLAAGADPTTTDEYGLTPLHQAAASGNAANVKLLLQAGADPLAKDVYGITPIDAAIGEAYDVLKEHFDQANAIAKFILEAAYEGNATQVARLLAEGVPVNITDAKGYAPLHVAALAGHTEMARLLLDRGADVNMIALDGATPFKLAFINGNIGVVNLLLERGATMPAFEPAQQSPKYYSPAPPCPAKPSPKKCSSALHSPTQYSIRGPMCSFVCSKPNECTSRENTHQTEGSRVFEKANPSKTQNPARALFFAAKTGDAVKLLEILNSGDVGVNEKFSHTTTALHVAARYGHKEVLRMLLERDANPDIKDRYGERPLHWAAAFGHVECVRTLIAFGAQVNAWDNDNRTPLHDAVLANQEDSVRALLDAGADQSLRDSSGKTPMEYVESNKIKSMLLGENVFPD